MNALSFEQFLELCGNRRAIRYFLDKPVDDADLHAVLTAGHLAPSVQNTQPWRFHVIHNKELRAKMMDASCYGNFTEGAAVLIVVSCDKTSVPAGKTVLWNPKEMEYSCMAAMEQMWLAATAKGLGACWVSLHHGLPHELLKLPREEVVVGALMVGHLRPADADDTAHDRRPIGEVISFHM